MTLLRLREIDSHFAFMKFLAINTNQRTNPSRASLALEASSVAEKVMNPKPLDFSVYEGKELETYTGIHNNHTLFNSAILFKVLSISNKK